MQVPAILYGDAKEVRNRRRTVLRGWLKSDVPYIEAMEADGVLDIADFRAPISLEFSPPEIRLWTVPSGPYFLLVRRCQGRAAGGRGPAPWPAG
jgi:hypothetical protein